LLRLCGWEPSIPLYDPMCGSGTLLIEAALSGKQIPAGYFREGYGFMKWRDFDDALWRQVKQETDAGISSRNLRIHGSDRSAKALASAGENVLHTGLEKDIVLENRSFEDTQPPFERGFIVSNPPYDERLPIDDSLAFYKMIGDVLKQKYAGYTAWLISSDLESIKFIGLRPSRRIPVMNGPLECRFLKFDLFEGKKGSRS
ncbi:MAG TPA: RNA methyltransferase, partial [Bacteroidales bacterium]|nr:RNA methyltransferase [Bacteroidales bacterium]